MINQLNMDDHDTYAGLTTISDAVSDIATEDLTVRRAPSANLGGCADENRYPNTGVSTGRCT